MALFVKGFRVMRRTTNTKGVESFAKIGRIFHVRSSAQQLCDMMNADAQAREPNSAQAFFVTDVAGRDGKESK